MSTLARTLTRRSEADTGRLIETVWVSAVVNFPHAGSPVSARAWLFSRLIDALSQMPDFLPADDPWEGHWKEFPAPWRTDPEGWEYSPEGRAVLQGALDRLPPLERTVLILRDLDGWSASEVSALTHLLPGRQREILFSARLMIRAAIDPVLRQQPRADQEPGVQDND